MSEFVELSKAVIEYHDKWSVALFSTSITLASFIFTMKSFVIQTVKKNVYDTEQHKSLVKKRRFSGANTDYYGGLRRLSNLLKWTIILAVFNSVCQLTLSILNNFYASAFCIVISLALAALFSYVVYYVSLNITEMINLAENKACDEADKS